MRNFAQTALAVVLLAALGFLIGWKTCVALRFRPVEPIVDTVYYFDTITREKAVFYERRVLDTVLVPVDSIIRTTDTVYVALEREQVVWEDSLARVWASGIRPRVDSVRHYVKNTVVTITTQEPAPSAPRVSFGVSGGPGVFYDGKVHGGVGVLAGVQVRF